jgi:tetratricopeptide (TPR) repeat protein
MKTGSMSRHQNNISELFYLANQLGRHHQRQKAIAAYRKITVIPGLRINDPLTLELAHWAMAELMIMERDSIEAEKHLLIAIELNSTEANYYQELGSLYSYLDRFEDATIQLKKSLDLRPYHPTTMHLLGWAVFMAGDLKSGREIMERALKLDNCDISILNDLAVCLVEMKLYEEAIRHLNRAIELDPKNELLQSYRQMVMGKKTSY